MGGLIKFVILKTTKNIDIKKSYSHSQRSFKFFTTLKGTVRVDSLTRKDKKKIELATIVRGFL